MTNQSPENMTEQNDAIRKALAEPQFVQETRRGASELLKTEVNVEEVNQDMTEEGE